jgi:hypothetical protein
MATPEFGNEEFLLGHCPVCAKDVLTHIDIGPDDEEIRCCVHCDAHVGNGMRAVSADELEAFGYAIVDARVCGNGGGCSAGGCGLRR